MTNIIILFSTILGGFLVGKHFEKQEMQKGQFFADLSKYLTLFATNVKGRKVELQNFNCEFAQSCSAVFAKFLRENSLPTFLSQNQKQLITACFSNLSANTSYELLNNLSYFEQLIESEKVAISNSVRNKSVFVKLGILLGVMVGILLM